MPSITSTVRGRRRARADRSGMRSFRARVIRATRISPNVVRVSLVGEDLAALPFAGADQRVKLLLPRAGQERPQLDGLETIWEIMALPDEVRPIMRTYTVRSHRPAAAEVDIDFAVHGDLGPASRWAVAARPGDEVALFGPAADYEPPADTQWQLIAGDESALPAIGAIVESLRHYDRAVVLIELADLRDAQRFDSRAEVEVTWLPRGPVPAHKSPALIDAVRCTDIPGVPAYFWIAGEASIATGIRRHLVNERGVNRDDVQFTGYWRHGRTESDA
jgi:NADPH-dependent ferric siderophore reductase